MATAGIQTVPSHMRSEPGSVNIPVAKFPSASNPARLDVDKTATDLVEKFNNTLNKGDYQAVSELFVEEGFWRDHLALSWAFRTVRGPKGVLELLQHCAGSRDGLRLKSIAVDRSSIVRTPQVAPMDGSGDVSGVQFFLKLETVIGSGEGVARLVESHGTWKIFTLYTSLQNLKGHEEAVYHRRVHGVEHGEKLGRKNWAEQRTLESGYGDGSQPSVLIVGAGQAGLTAAARLKALGVKTLVIDQNDRVGDNWRKRYHQLVLHDPVWYDHMPYLKFPPQWPIFTPKDKLAQFFESYANLLELNVWMKTVLADSKWDDGKGVWTVTLHRKDDNGTSHIHTLHPRHIIQATGHSGKKDYPSIKGMENFRGDHLYHSSEFPGAREHTQGKKAVVVGSCNSGLDIAQDFLEKGYDVTIVQRSSTNVVSSKSITEIALKGTYSEDGPPVEDADMLVQSIPTPVLKAIQVRVAALQAENDKEILEGLVKAGFRVDRGPDDAGIFFKYFQRGGGYYIDVGASQLIADGKIKVKQGQEITEVLPHGLRFTDNSELEADEIVFATGYKNMRTQTRLIFGDEVADKVSDVWGFNDEGELRTIWQSSGHPGFWFHGGNLALCRYYSKLLALQIKALEEGIYQYGDS